MEMCHVDIRDWESLHNVSCSISHNPFHLILRHHDCQTGDSLSSVVLPYSVGRTAGGICILSVTQ